MAHRLFETEGQRNEGMCSMYTLFTCLSCLGAVRYHWEAGVSETDRETKAIGEIAGIVGALDEDQQGRVIRYIVERFNIAGTLREAKVPHRGKGGIFGRQAP